MKNLFILTTFLLAFSLSTFADHGPRIQFIHNSADDEVATVDIWYTFESGGIYPPQKLYEGVNYKEATEYSTFSLIYGALTFYVTPAGSEGISEYFLMGTFGQPEIEYEETYVIVITGDPGLDMEFILTEGSEANVSINYTKIKAFHGSVGAPAINIVETSIPLGTVFEDLEYGESQGYSTLLATSNTWEIQTNDGLVVAEFSVPLNFFEESPLVVLASGYLDTTGTTSNNPFILLAVKPNGEVYEIYPNQGSGASPRLQVIHNSASDAAAMVDVWITDAGGSIKLLENFKYKEATPYIDAPISFTVSITVPGSTDTTNAVLHKNFILNSGGEYVVIAAGDPGSNFDLFSTAGSETVSTAGNTELKVFHGSVGAPEVDIDEVSIPAGILVDNLSFGSAQGFLDLASIDYDLQVLTQSGIAAAEFSVPLSGFSDEVLIVAATGYLDTTGVTPNNPFKLLAVTPSGMVVEIDRKENLTPAMLQIIHNSATPALDSVDLYLNGVKIADNFAFRTATTFMEVPGATEFTVDVDVKTSIDNSFPVYSENLILSSGRKHVVVASGVVVFGSENYFPPKDFELITLMDPRESSMDMTKVDVKVFHGSTDAPAVDVNELTVPVMELVNDIEYGTEQGYLQLDPAVYELEVALASSGNTVNTYRADVSSLDGQAVTILASGFVNTIKNNNGADFGLWLALPSGGNLIELPIVEENPTARVQVIHNSSDAAASMVDVWLDNTLLLDDFMFRTSSPFIDAPAGVDFTIAIKGPDSEDSNNPIWSNDYNLEVGKSYILIANGIVSESGYNPSTPFDIYVYDMGRESANSSGNTDVLVFHGSTDAPIVDVVETGVGAGTIVDNIGYGEFQGYLELPTADYQLSVKDENGTSTVVVYSAPLETLGLQDAALVTVASGFLNPDNNSNGSGFGLWVALPAGGPMVELPNITSVDEEIINDASIMIYPNPTSDFVNLNFNLLEDADVNIYIRNLSGQVVASRSYGMISTTNYNTSMNIDNLDNGLYLLSIQAGKSMITRKIQVLN